MLCAAMYEDGQAITRNHICSELITFLFAGHETTALSLTWAVYHLHKNMDTLSRVAIAPATVLAHYNPSTYTEPELFRPKRFIDHSYSAFEYMPFGGGYRRCIGAAFASYEMAIVLGTIRKRYQLELVDSNLVVPKRRNVTIGPSSGVPIRVNRR